MPFSEDSLSLADIRDAVAAIEQFTRDMDFDAFREDPKTIAAVERKLQVISEAAVRLGERAEALCPGLPWRNIRGIGNWLRHQYDRVDIETLWNTVTIDLPPLKAAVNRCVDLGDSSATETGLRVSETACLSENRRMLASLPGIFERIFAAADGVVRDATATVLPGVRVTYFVASRA